MGALWAIVCNFARKMIKTINSWRGIAVIITVILHSTSRLSNAGAMSVTFFFISSAFLLSMKYPFDRLTTRNYGHFFMSHVMRLFPLHWLALALLIVITLLLTDESINWFSTALNALLLQCWFPQHDFRYGLNPVAWFLAVLIYCYLFYPLLAHWLYRSRLRTKALVLLVLMIVLAVILLPLDIPGRERVKDCPLSHLPDIVAGMTCFHLYHVLKDRCRNVGFYTATSIELVAISLWVPIHLVYRNSTFLIPWDDDLIWIVPMSAILLVSALLNGQEGAVGRVLASRPFQWLGNITFEVFMLQFVAFKLYNYVLAPFVGHFGIDIHGKIVYYVWPLLFVLCWVVNRVFTRPVSRYVKQRFK